MSNVWLCQEMRETYNVHHNKIGCNKSFLAVRTYRKLKICILDMNSILLSNTSNSSDTNNVACVVLQFVVSSMLTKYAKETDNKLETRLFFSASHFIQIRLKVERFRHFCLVCVVAMSLSTMAAAMCRASLHRKLSFFDILLDACFFFFFVFWTLCILLKRRRRSKNCHVCMLRTKIRLAQISNDEYHLGQIKLFWQALPSTWTS